MNILRFLPEVALAAALTASPQSTPKPGITGETIPMGTQENGTLLPFYGNGTHFSFNSTECIGTKVRPNGPRTVEVLIENNCSSQLMVVWVHLKYFDKDGFRISSDADIDGITIPSFPAGEKVKRTVTLAPGSVRAAVRDITAIK